MFATGPFLNYVYPPLARRHADLRIVRQFSGLSGLVKRPLLTNLLFYYNLVFLMRFPDSEFFFFSPLMR